ncbi:MAG: acetate--CoA ligase family protein [Alphaproteobacteria bacterium]|nr:acetate--CoA ligase family protein [Alphaproteobacteria bacterium]
MIPPPPERLRAYPGPSLFAAGRCVLLHVAGIDGVDLPEDWAAALRRHPALAEAASPPAGAAAAVAWLAQELQRALGHPVPDGTGGGTAADHVVVPVWDAEVGAAAARTAFAIVAAPGSQRGEVVAHLNRFFATANVIDYSESEARVIRAAERRGIPWNRLVPGHRLLRLGQGAWQMHVQHTFTPATSRIATYISTHKDIAAALLRAQGLPVPAGRRVGSADAAVAAAAAIGYPVVVKPTATDYGTAVSLHLRDEADVRRAYAAAARHGPVLVERQLPGDHTRLVVIDGRFISAVRQDPAQVTGDGRRSVAGLIDAVNAERTDDVSASFKKIAIDAEATLLLERQGLGLASVPEAGRRVVLRHTSNTSRGGTARNATALVHPDNARLAERAAAVVGLDVAGIDLITPDITRSFREVGGGICEINATPGFFMREPGYLIEDAFLDGHFRAGDRGLVPIVALLAEPGEGAAAAEEMARGLRARVRGVAVVAPCGARIDARIDDWPIAERTIADATATVLNDPATRAAVVCLDRRTIAEDGIGFARCAVALMPPDAAGAAAALLAAHADERIDAADRARVAAALDAVAATASRAAPARRR